MKRTAKKLRIFRSRRLQGRVLSIVVLIASVISASAMARAQSETVLYSFSGGADGGFPAAGLIQDAEGNFYGTTSGDEGHKAGLGTVFKLTSDGTETVLHAFAFNGGVDGKSPQAGLIQDTQGNLYGTTSEGGIYGSGTVFEVTAAGAETILYSFRGGGDQPIDGSTPYAGLVRDAEGNLYGTTAYGGDCLFGNCNSGTVFKVTPSGTETILHSFTGNPDGVFPYARLVRDANSHMYGTTAYGGVVGCGCGVVFEVNATGKFRIVYSFIRGWADGKYPYAGLVGDAEGNLYGTTGSGGGSGQGTVFEITAAGKENELHRFQKSDGSNPQGDLVRDAEGNLYGTTTYGGAFEQGTVFKVTASGVEKVLYSFTGAADGRYPQGGLIQDAQGNLYGTTYGGGAYDYGTVFKVIP